MSVPQGEFFIVTNDTDRRYLISCIEAMDLTKPKVVQVGDRLPTRSQLQNRFLWGWVYKNIEQQLEDGGIVIRCDDGREVPYTKEILHEIFKRKFLVVGVLEAKGKSLELYESTTKLNTKQFCEFVEKVQKFVFQFWQITVPPPIGFELVQWQQWAEEARKE